MQIVQCDLQAPAKSGELGRLRGMAGCSGPLRPEAKHLRQNGPVISPFQRTVIKLQLSKNGVAVFQDFCFTDTTPCPGSVVAISFKSAVAFLSRDHSPEPLIRAVWLACCQSPEVHMLGLSSESLSLDG
ncbi:MAG: hypothetical protein JSS02_12545 [Planctomycetes bacterium]|nr:hypothetical protein [Planctomycetota bacterium]